MTRARRDGRRRGAVGSMSRALVVRKGHEGGWHAWPRYEPFSLHTFASWREAMDYALRGDE